MRKTRFVAILLAFVLSASNILSPINVRAEDSNVQVSGELTENAVEDITDKPEENTEEKENITEELPTEEDVSKEPDKEAMHLRISKNLHCKSQRNRSRKFKNKRFQSRRNPCFRIR